MSFHTLASPYANELERDKLSDIQMSNNVKAISRNMQNRESLFRKKSCQDYGI